MLTETQPNRLTLEEAKQLRQQAGELLNRLIADRDASDRRAVESGKRDPMKSITGRTALENAITTARDMIVQMDSLLASLQLDGEKAASVAKLPRHTLKSPARATIKSPFRPVPVPVAP
jgi:hypothetical protein